MAVDDSSGPSVPRTRRPGCVPWSPCRPPLTLTPCAFPHESTRVRATRDRDVGKSGPSTYGPICGPRYTRHISVSLFRSRPAPAAGASPPPPLPTSDQRGPRPTGGGPLGLGPGACPPRPRPATDPPRAGPPPRPARPAPPRRDTFTAGARRLTAARGAPRLAGQGGRRRSGLARLLGAARPLGARVASWTHAALLGTSGRAGGPGPGRRSSRVAKLRLTRGGGRGARPLTREPRGRSPAGVGWGPLRRGSRGLGRVPGPTPGPGADDCAGFGRLGQFGAGAAARADSASPLSSARPGTGAPRRSRLAGLPSARHGGGGGPAGPGRRRLLHSRRPWPSLARPPARWGAGETLGAVTLRRLHRPLAQSSSAPRRAPVSPLFRPHPKNGQDLRAWGMDAPPHTYTPTTPDAPVGTRFVEKGRSKTHPREYVGVEVRRPRPQG